MNPFILSAQIEKYNKILVANSFLIRISDTPHAQTHTIKYDHFFHSLFEHLLERKFMIPIKLTKSLNI